MSYSSSLFSVNFLCFGLAVGAHRARAFVYAANTPQSIVGTSLNIAKALQRGSIFFVFWGYSCVFKDSGHVPGHIESVFHSSQQQSLVHTIFQQKKIITTLIFQVQLTTQSHDY